MFFQGDISSNKTEKLVASYVKLLNSGVDSSRILVLLQNSNRKNDFIQKTLENLTIDSLEKLQVYSFFGLVYNTISDNWAKIENLISDDRNTKILPNLTGLEISQYIFKQIIQDIKFEGYNSKKSLLHQLFRRYSLIVQNNLSDKDVKWRSDSVLRESFAPDAKLAIDKLKKKTLELRAFDYLRQSLIFNYIYTHEDYFKNIEYLILDDADEITPICIDFVKYLKPQLKDVFIGYDAKGSSRSGYLSASKNAVAKLQEVFGGEIQQCAPKTNLIKDAETIFANVINQTATKLNYFTLTSLSKRAKMFDLATEKVKDLINNGIKPCDIAIITPVIDDMLKFCIKEELSPYANIVSLSGSEKIVQNRIVKAILTILKLCNENCELDEFELRSVFEFLQIPLKYCKEIFEKFNLKGGLVDYEFSLEEYTQSYKSLLAAIEEIPKIEKLSQQVYAIYEKLVDVKKYSKEELKKFSFFISQIEDYENVLDIENSEIIKNIENSIISENPYSTLEIKDSDLVVATPQKIVDNQLRTKFQIWLDVSSDEWIKSDTGPLYNAWVMQADWDKDEFTIQDNIELSRQKTARILRKLVLCAKKQIFAYASLFDSSGIENFGGIEKYLSSQKNENVTITHKKFVPREDQKPVLKYTQGTMAISAVPGAGKTTILLELIINLLKRGVQPENIYVMTYMESAARNFRERIQSANPDMNNLPNISTIHGLALKILKENDNYEKLGLSSNFEICDDTQRSRILREISSKYEIKKTESEDFDRAVSILKMGKGDIQKIVATTDKKLAKFVKFYTDYVKILKENNLIDYDDMLLMSVKLLEENPDVLAYYQELCHYIIEDEAQDSSAIQQRLINMLCAKHKNLVRCGDINQAITTTFSNADVEGFRKFIQAAQTKVSMDSSQRCTKGVWTLANRLVKFADSCDASKNAFYDIFMKPVEGRNPEESNAIKKMSFENDFSERSFILKKIKELLKKNPKATIGILLRSNFLVGRWTSFIGNSGLKTITRSECLEQKGVFRTIFAILKMIESPFDNEVVAESYNTLAELGFAKSNLYQTIKEYPQSFIQADVDLMNNVGLENFYWDLIYWLSNSNLPPEELAIKIGLYYYSTEIEKSNVYLISTLIKRLSVNGEDFTALLNRLEELSKKPSLSGFKFFSEEEKSDKEILEGKVQIMTLHKSKGDEFDYVFLPEMTETNLPLLIENVKLKKNARFMESIRELNSEYMQKTDEELKEFLLAENLRLMYVAITRAKRKLFVSSNKSTRTKTVPEPSAVTALMGGL